MGDLSTKQKILQSSLLLFNKHGIANVRLQQIADETGISVGNLAYHFKNKEAIIEAAEESLKDDLTDVLSTYRLFPNLIDFDHQLTKYYEFIEKYPFYFSDLIEIQRVIPRLHRTRRQYIAKMISQIRKRFEFNEKRDVVRSEEVKGSYDLLANSIWVLISFWHIQVIARGVTQESSLELFKETVWNLIYPYFTEKGRAEFEQLIVPMINQSR